MMNDPSLSLALRVCNAINKELDSNFYSAVMSGKPLERLPQIAEDSTIERGERADARKGRARRLVVADRPAGVAEIRVQGADRGVS